MKNPLSLMKLFFFDYRFVFCLKIIAYNVLSTFSVGFYTLNTLKSYPTHYYFY